MDELVLQAMARWPEVPAMYGWLRLDRRGHWMLVDRGQPGFDEALHGLGSPITSAPITDFIGRNYAHDDDGCWYWQNGPQRVFVDLDVAPLLLRVLGSPGEARSQQLVTHTGYLVERIERVLADEGGVLFVVTELGPAAIDDRDLAALDLELDMATATAAHGSTIGRLRLMGEHPVQRLEGDPATALGFVRRPRPGMTGPNPTPRP
jgi:hypothetical protein